MCQRANTFVYIKIAVLMVVDFSPILVADKKTITVLVTMFQLL